MAVNDDELERRAVEELLKEANRGRLRAETMGPAGWMKCPLGSTNKRFLVNTLRPCAAERRSESRSVTAREAKDRRREEDRRSHDRAKNREHRSRKGTKHKQENPRSHSQSSKPRDSSTSESTGHTPHAKSRSNRTRFRSRSPIREHVTKKIH